MYYVTMTDSFMSDWGKAKGLTNKLIFECETMEEARIVENNAKKREEMKRINICTKRPYYYRVGLSEYKLKNFLVQVVGREGYEKWYRQ